MTPREELEGLRHMAALRGKAGPEGARPEPAEGVLQQQMTPREELEGLRRVAELRRRAPPREPTDVISRIAQGVADPVIGLGQIAEKTGIPGAIRKGLGLDGSTMEDVVRQRDKAYVAPEGVDWARMGGNVLSPLSWVAPGAGVARAAAMGATQAAMAPTEAGLDLGSFAKEKAKQAGLGGAAGGVLAKALPRALGGLIKPSEAGAALQQQGVRVTPGQAAGGWVNALEQKATSLPVAGGVITKARHRALEDVQSAAIERATGIPGVKSIDDANEAVRDLYRQAVPHLKANEAGFYGASEALYRATANPELTPQHVRTLQGLFNNNFHNYEQLSGEGLKKLDSQLGALARKYTGHTATPADRSLGDALYEVRMGLREGLEQGMPAEHAATLRRANKAYRNMVPINKAASSRADELVTPRALQKALARQARTDTSRMRADPLLDPAVQALGATVPDSGTAGRLSPYLLGGAFFNDPISTLLTAGAGWAGAKALYSKTGTNILTGNTGLQRRLAKMEPNVRAAFIAALRAQQAGGR